MHPIPTEETQSKTSCQEINVWRQRQNQDALPFKINSTTQADNRSVLTIEPKHELLDAHGQAAAIEILHVRLANIFGATGYGYNSIEINMFCNAF